MSYFLRLSQQTLLYGICCVKYSPAKVIFLLQLCELFESTGEPIYQFHQQNWRSYVIDDVYVLVCHQAYYRSSQLISLTLCGMIGPINVKNQLTFDGDSILDTDSGSLPSALHNGVF